MGMVLEACVESFEEAIRAAGNGAHRIELCSQLDLDGLTPPAELTERVCRTLLVPVMVMIRPRPGSFVFSRQETDHMVGELLAARSLGAAGFVIGLLTAENTIDLPGCQRLVTAAYPLPVTFHKAVDRMADPVEGVRQLKMVPGITRILTSGGKPTASEGAPKIREMIREADGRLVIVVAGKVTNVNVAEICRLTGATEFHGRKITG